VRQKSVWAFPTIVLAGVALAIPLTTMSAQAVVPGSATPAKAVTPTATTARPAGTITLATGEQVRTTVQANGAVTRSARPLAGNGPGQVMISRTQGSDQYVMPTDAAPYLGRFLDPAIFDVTRLATAQTANHRLAVSISYTGKTPSVPGVTITSAAAGVAQGYLTPASSVTFGQALSAQWKADAAAGWPRHSTLFSSSGSGIRKITADLPAAPAVAHPDYPQYTLIVKVIGPDGKPEADGELSVTNLDNANKVSATVEVVDGEARLSIPKGHYSAWALDDTLDQAGAEHVRFTTAPQFTFTGSGQTITIDHRQATVAPKLTLPKPAALDGYAFTFQRTGGDGYQAVETLQTSTPVDFRYAPTKATTIGRVDTFQKWSLSGGSGSKAYTYDLATAAARIPATSPYVFTAKDLATIKARYYNDGGHHDPAFFRSADYPHEASDVADYIPLRLGTARTEYVGATGTPTWFDQVVTDVNDFGDLDYDELIAPSRKIPAGTTLTANWLRGPLAAGIPKQRGSGEASDEEGETSCFACRTSKALSLTLRGVTDSDAYHYEDVLGAPDGLPVSRFRFYLNGKKIDDQTDQSGDNFTVPTGKASYRVIYDQDRRVAKPLQSTISRTELTFSSAKGTGPKVPASLSCPVGTACRMLPIVQAKLALPTDLNGRLPIGKSTVTMTVARIQHAGTATAKKATLEIRPADNDWSTVKLTSIGGGRFRGTIDNSADLAGLDVDVRFSGTDTAGSTFTQTVVRAYTVAGS